MAKIELKSDVGAGYSRLRDLLINGQWEEADRETLFIMVRVLPNVDEGFVGDMREFPCTDLQTIDQLWVKHSQGRFGFSVQQEIWQNLGGKLKKKSLDDEQESLLRDVFASKVGWKIDDSFINPFELNFSLDAPMGELPAMWVNSDTVIAASGQIYAAWKRLKTCNIS
ncbi:MAG: GUN4 domain-containing protein [Snowella sp.]|nr:GUN4 domain-containing protein [Snowella sp.]